MFTQSMRFPRAAFSAREVARAREVWKLFQELAVDASVDAGWPPERYRTEATAFVMRTMTVKHAREGVYGEELTGKTWVSRMRREMFCTREVRLLRGSSLLAAARQEWVHVSAALEPMRAKASLLSVFPEEKQDEMLIEVPPVTEGRASAVPRVYSFQSTWTDMDPLDHANHTAYIGWCEEAIAQEICRREVNPVRVVPIAETVTFRRGVTGGKTVHVETSVQGYDAEGNAVFSHRIRCGEELCATAMTVRALHGESGRSSLVEWFV